MNILRAIRQRVRAMARAERKALDALERKIRALYEGREMLQWSMQVPYEVPQGFMEAFPYRWEWGKPGIMSRDAYEALPEYAWERASHATWQMLSIHMGEGRSLRDLTLEQALTIARHICRWNAPWESQIAWVVPHSGEWALLSSPHAYLNLSVVSFGPGKCQHVDWTTLGYWEEAYRGTLPLIEGWNAPLEAPCA